jgi:L(+)-tartrate dehydratase alpha subunit
MIRAQTIYQSGVELNRRAAIKIPDDARRAIERMYEQETHKLSSYVLGQIVQNYAVAMAEQRPMCADTGLPRFYAKVGNEARLEGGMVALERALRQATADATESIPLRPNRVHPLTRKDFNNNVGVHAPSVDYSFEPHDDWLDLTVVHKGGLFGGDYRMLFPADGIPGMKRFFLDSISEFFRRGMSCQPLVVGLGIGGTKDYCVCLAKESACLRLVGDRNPIRRSPRLRMSCWSWATRPVLAPWAFQVVAASWMWKSRSLMPTPAACQSPSNTSASPIGA